MKAKFHLEAAVMLGCEVARCKLGALEAESALEASSGNMEWGLKHFTIAASAGDYIAMNAMRGLFELGHVRRESIDSTLTAYNNSCAEMRSKARDDYIQMMSSDDRII